MSGQPGAGCDDPRELHPHWCGFCGAEEYFSAFGCAALLIIPPCPRCGEHDWRSEAEGKTQIIRERELPRGTE